MFSITVNSQCFRQLNVEGLSAALRQKQQGQFDRLARRLLVRMIQVELLVYKLKGQCPPYIVLRQHLLSLFLLGSFKKGSVISHGG